MTLTAAETERLKGAWRTLARLALAFGCDPSKDPRELRAQAHDAVKWLSPLDRAEEAYVLFGFARLAVAIARTRLIDVPARAGAVSAVAELVLSLVGAADPAPPQLPFRADING